MNAQLFAQLSKRWHKLSWQTPFGKDDLLVSEKHYLDLENLALTSEQRCHLNHLFACFSFELFIHFERYVIEYLSAHEERIPRISRAAREKFIVEEEIHTQMFFRLLRKIRPDLYPTDSYTGSLHFVRWSWGDRSALKLTPLVSFFALTWLFEEVTLFVPETLGQEAGAPGQLVRDVVTLHAQEEKSHTAIDAQILMHLSAAGKRWRTASQIIMTLFVLLFINTKVKGAWRRLVKQAAREVGLTDIQQKKLIHRGITQSDRLGIESFCRKISTSNITGSRFLVNILRRQLPDAV